MEIKKLSEDLQVGDLYVTFTYDDNSTEDVTVQETDGTTLFNGSKKQAQELYEVFKEILNG